MGARRRAGWEAILVLTAFTWGLDPALLPPARGAERTAVSDVAVHITMDRATYASDDPITLTLRVINGTDSPVTFTFRNAQRFDFVVRDRNGQQVWRWAKGQMFAQVLGSETIPPSGALVYTATVAKRLSPGVYTATGLLTVAEGHLTASVLVRVTPR